MSDAFQIPDDLTACQTLLEQFALTIDEQGKSIEQLKQEIEDQKLTIDMLIQRAFRARSERYIEDPNQLKFDFANTDEAGDAAAGLAEAVEESQQVSGYNRGKPKKKKPRNEQLPAHLERYEVEAPVPDEAKFCPEHGERKPIGVDRVETLEFERPKLRVRVTLIAKFACEQNAQCGVTEAPRPQGLVEGNRYDTSVAAEIITGKYGYHLPIYRQQDWFAGSGWIPSRSTLLNILSASAPLIAPLVRYLRDQVLASVVLGTDDTSVTLLLPQVIPEPIPDDPKSQRIHEVFTNAREAGNPSVLARMWVYRSLTEPINLFDFTVSRHRDGPDSMLVDGGFTGTMMGDCYSGYQQISLRSDERITRAACLAHARRKTFDARENYPLLSSQLLAMIQELYDIEDRAREMSVSDRVALRQTEATLIWQRIDELLDSPLTAGVLPKDKFAEALRYLRNHRDPLRVYLSDGRVPIDNNDVEQLMKQVALGRKNWLFVGSVAAGERAADFMTLVSSAIRNDLDVWLYLKDVLDQLLAGSDDYASMRPDRWAADHPEAIRTYRQEERRDRFDSKRRRRAKRRKR